VSSVVVQRSRLDGPMAQRASSDQLDSGAIAGIVVGSIIGAALAGFVLFTAWRKMRGGKQRSLRVEPDGPGSPKGLRVAPMHTRTELVDCTDATPLPPLQTPHAGMPLPGAMPLPPAAAAYAPTSAEPAEQLCYSFDDVELGMVLADAPSGGVHVRDVAAGGPAAKLGVVEGALLTSVGTTSVRGMNASLVDTLISTCVTRPLSIEMVVGGGVSVAAELGTLDSPLKGVPVWKTDGVESKGEVAAPKLGERCEQGGEGRRAAQDLCG